MKIFVTHKSKLHNYRKVVSRWNVSGQNIMLAAQNQMEVRQPSTYSFIWGDVMKIFVADKSKVVSRWNVSRQNVMLAAQNQMEVRQPYIFS